MHACVYTILGVLYVSIRCTVYKEMLQVKAGAAVCFICLIGLPKPWFNRCSKATQHQPLQQFNAAETPSSVAERSKVTASGVVGPWI